MMCLKIRFSHFVCLLFLGAIIPSFAAIQTISLKPNAEVSVAQIFVWKPERGDEQRERGSQGDDRGVLVLCPGQNGSSEAMLRDRHWQEFAQREHLTLVGMHFVSSDKDLLDGKGYFVASRGSGKALERGLAEAGLKDEPVFLYGFSGGAHFTISFAAWRPQRVAAFCAYSFAWWSPPPKALRCPAAIVCGQRDGLRYGSTLAYFQAGRAEGKPWCWISLKNTPHARNAKLDAFVRTYFAGVKRLTEGNEGNEGQLSAAKISLSSFPFVQSFPENQMLAVNNQTKREVAEAKPGDVSDSVLPGKKVEAAWRKVHHP